LGKKVQGKYVNSLEQKIRDIKCENKQSKHDLILLRAVSFSSYFLRN